MFCLGRMFLNLLEAHLLALPPPKQCAAGKRCFSLVDDSFAFPPPKQCAAGKRCFSLADDLLTLPPPKQSAAGNK